MDEERCKQIALFRYGVISDFVNQTTLPFGAQEKLLEYKSNCEWKIPYSDRNKISRGTIIHWIRLYRAGETKLEALCRFLARIKRITRKS
jgi:putative transposase